MHHQLSLRFVVPAIVCVAFCGLPGCGTATPPQASNPPQASTPTTAAPDEDIPAASTTPAATETAATPQSDATPATAKESVQPVPNKQEVVSVDDTPRKPATVAEAARVLDLRTLPLIEGAEVPGWRRQLGTLYYNVKAKLMDAFTFHLEQLKASDWKVLPGIRLEEPNPRAVLTRAGFVVQLSASAVAYPPEMEGYVNVSMMNHGNVLSRRLPIPKGVDENYVDDTMAMYITENAADEMREQCDQMLLDLGWKPYGSAGDTRYFKQNAIMLHSDVSTHEARPGKTFISYRTELLSADLPMLLDYEDPRYNDSQKKVTFDCPKADLTKVASFYSQELSEQGWKPTTTEPAQIDDKTFVIFRNQPGDMIELEFEHFRDVCRVSVEHSTADEVAALERRIKEEAQQRAAALAANNNRSMRNVAIPIPGKASKVTQEDDESIDIVVAKGTANAVLKAWQKHFKEAGWQVNQAVFEEQDSYLELSKGEPAIDVSAFDSGFEPNVTISVRGLNVEFELDKSVVAFAALGAPVAIDPPPKEMVAKVPADIPIPADAQQLKVQPNTNVMFDVAGSVGDVATYFQEAMQRHGWEFDEDFSQIDDDTALLSFKKGRAPCSTSITDILDSGVASVTVAGGGMNWDQLKGIDGKLDLAVATSPSSGAATKVPARGILASQVPVPKKAASLQMEADLEMIIYRSEMSVDDLAEYYRK